MQQWLWIKEDDDQLPGATLLRIYHLPSGWNLTLIRVWSQDTTEGKLSYTLSWYDQHSEYDHHYRLIVSATILTNRFSAFLVPVQNSLSLLSILGTFVFSSSLKFFINLSTTLTQTARERGRKERNKFQKITTNLHHPSSKIIIIQFHEKFNHWCP